MQLKAHHPVIDCPQDEASFVKLVGQHKQERLARKNVNKKKQPRRAALVERGKSKPTRKQITQFAVYSIICTMSLKITHIFVYWVRKNYFLRTMLKVDEQPFLAFAWLVCETCHEKRKIFSQTNVGDVEIRAPASWFMSALLLQNEYCTSTSHLLHLVAVGVTPRLPI